MVGKNLIYVLVDPRNLKVRYIGITCQSLNDRLGNHIHDAKHHRDWNYHKANWINQLLELGMKPIIRKIAEIEDRAEAEALESMLITKYKEKHNLINVSLGNGQFTSIGQHSASVLNAKKVFVYDYDGNFVTEYPSIKECALSLEIYIGNVEKVLRGNQRFAKGYQFSYTKVDKMESLENYSTGSSKEVVLLDNETGEILRFKSGVDCKKKLNLQLGTTSNKYILGALNKFYGNKYSMLVDGKFTQSTYYNTGIQIECEDHTYQFKSKKDLLKYMGFKSISMDEKTLTQHIMQNFLCVKDIIFRLPLCQINDNDN